MRGSTRVEVPVSLWRLLEGHGAEGRSKRLLIPRCAIHGVGEASGRLRNRCRNGAVDRRRHHEAVVGQLGRLHLRLQCLLLGLRGLLVGDQGMLLRLVLGWSSSRLRRWSDGRTLQGPHLDGTRPGVVE